MKVSITDLQHFLQDIGLVTFSQWRDIQKEVEEKGEKIEEVLVRRKIVTKETLLQIKAHILGIPFINLEKTLISPDVLHLIPEQTSKTYQVVAYRKTGDKLEVAMIDPDNLQALDFIQKKTGLEMLPRLTNEASVANALKQYNESIEEEFSELVAQVKLENPMLRRQGKEGDEGRMILKGEGGLEEGTASEEDLKKVAENISTVKVVDSILHHAVIENASDIHIEPLENGVIVRYRIDGILHDIMTLPRTLYAGLTARIKVLSALKLDEHRLPQDGRFKIDGETYKFSVRVSFIPVMDGEKVVMRLLREDSKGLTLELLGLWGNPLEIVRRNIKKPNGILLVTGPTGSGKTTTLYAVTDLLNTPEVNIATIEDPIEYRMPRINQTQVKPQIGLTFANGLRALLRQDPDIIMVGEIRDNETASLAINAALTGHLVLSTLHTNSASGALPRLIDMGIEPFLIASTANIIVAQRLVRKFCSNHKEKYMLTSDEVEVLGKQYNLEEILADLKERSIVGKDASWETIPFARPKASEECPDGYKGRLAIFEVLEISPAIQKLIIKHASADDIQAQAKQEGMITMVEDGFAKAAQELTSIEEIIRVTKE